MAGILGVAEHGSRNLCSVHSGRRLLLAGRRAAVSSIHV